MDWIQFAVSIAVAVFIMHALLILGPAYGILLERKIASWAQDRIGPNRVGPFGLLQPIADGLKFMMKEDYTPGNVDKSLFSLGPMLAVIPALIGWAVIPWGGDLITPWGTFHISVIDVNIGVIFILAAGSLSVYGLSIGAWASNNKYTFIGGIRATAQMLSYEIPMGLCVLVILIMVGAAGADDIVAAQVNYWWGFIPSWFIFQQPIAAVLFYTCVLAEANRAPFDLAEAEQELIGGFHTEYSSMRFALFFLGEYIHMYIGAAFFTVLFLGGWHLPWIDYVLYGEPMSADGMAYGGVLGGLVGDVPLWVISLIGVIIKIHVFLAKVVLLVAAMMWIRWTLPRFRFDQLMKLAWKSLIPLSIALLLLTTVMVYLDLREYLWLGNVLLAIAIGIIMPMLPGAGDTVQVNRRVPLRGSRFSPVAE